MKRHSNKPLGPKDLEMLQGEHEEITSSRGVWQEEKHDAEQGGYIIKGRALLRIPDDDKELVLGPGDGYLIQSDRRHSWRYVDDEVIFIDFFSPPRFELLEQKLAPKAAMASPEE